MNGVHFDLVQLTKTADGSTMLFEGVISCSPLSALSAKDPGEFVTRALLHAMKDEARNFGFVFGSIIRSELTRAAMIDVAFRWMFSVKVVSENYKGIATDGNPLSAVGMLRIDAEWNF